MLEMGLHCYTEGLFCTFHKVTATSSMNVHFDTTRGNDTSVCIYLLGTGNR